MLKSAHSKKTAIGVLSVLLVLVISVCLSIHLDFFQNIFGPAKIYAIELEDGETWYGQIAAETEDSVTLSNVYSFHNENLTQLVSRDARRNPPKIIARNDIFSISLLSESSPVLKAIRKYEAR